MINKEEVLLIQTEVVKIHGRTNGLRIEGLRINASDDDLYSFVIKVSTGEIRFKEITDWLKKNTIPL